MDVLSKRIPTVVAILVLALGVAGGVWMVQKQKPKVSKEQIKPQGVKITNITDSKFSVSWITKGAVEGKIVYGKVGEKLTQEAKDDRDGGGTAGKYTTHHVTVTGLQPNTDYAFRIVEEKVQFDNNGSPYGVKTGPVLSTTPPAEAIYGVAKKNQTTPAKGAIVYVEIPGATPLSTLVKDSGNWTIPISVARTLDLSEYISYDPEATIFSVTVTDGRKQAKAKVALKFAKPIPEMVLGESYEFLAQAKPEPTTERATTESSQSGKLAQGETPKIFNIEPMNTGETTTEKVTVVYPEEGELVTTSEPEFRGTGPSGVDLSLSLSSLSGEVSLSEVVTVDNDGTWTWLPSQSLVNGSYTLTAEYVDSGGNQQTVERSFKVNLDETTPAFEASSSGEQEATKTTTTKRVTMPATEGGVPVSGVMDQTWLTAVIGFGIIILGGVLLSL